MRRAEAPPRLSSPPTAGTPPLPCSFGLLWLSSQTQQKRIADEEDVCGRFAYASVRMTGKANASPAAVFNTIATLSLDPTTGAW